MKWERRGLVWAPEGTADWARHSALQPTAIAVDDSAIRVFAGLRAADGASRVGWVDVDAADPTRVLRACQHPALDLGRPGTFDDNGVVPAAVVRRGGRLYLYYAGYMLAHRVRFLAFGGLAMSDDGGQSFERLAEVPLTDRTPDELTFRVIHCLLEEVGTWRAWYGGGSGFLSHEGRTLATYDIRTMESRDGFDFPRRGRTAIALAPGEQRVGRPCVMRTGSLYRMFFCAAAIGENYRLAYAESADGIEWTRKPLGLDIPPGSWDSAMAAYPNVVSHGGRVFLFYNGNDYGRQGFGCAVLREW